MTIAFSTDHLEPRDRIPYWVDAASKAFYTHSFAAEPTDFAGRLSTGSLDDLTLTIVDCGPCTVTRTRRDTVRDDLDHLMFCIRLEGRSLFTQSERRVVMEPGTLVFHDAAQPLKIEFLDQTKSIIVSIPRHVLRARISDGDFERVISSDAPAAGLTVAFVRALVERADQMDASLHRQMAAQVVDLVSLAVRSETAPGPLTTARATALRRLKSEIDKRLSDPGLNPGVAAAAAGMSVRYANMLLAGEGHSLERYIQHCRLDRCRKALEDPLQARRTISEIAFAWGFSDHAHFTRRFRAAFAMTPGDCREQSRARRA